MALAEGTAYDCISVNTNCLSIYFILYLPPILKLFLIYILYIPNNFIFRGTNINGNIFEVKIFTYLLQVYGTMTDFVSHYLVINISSISFPVGSFDFLDNRLVWFGYYLIALCMKSLIPRMVVLGSSVEPLRGRAKQSSGHLGTLQKWV